MWRQFRAEDLATPEAFSRDPVLVWEWYAWRRELIAACKPNPAHDVIARWSKTFERCTVITQNVDDLHVQAGTAPHGLQMRGLIVVLRVAVPTTDSAAPARLRGSARAQRRLPRARRLSRACARRCGAERRGHDGVLPVIERVGCRLMGVEPCRAQESHLRYWIADVAPCHR